MSYLPLLDETEIRLICSAIPQKSIISYFKKYPKDFARIKPGFRAQNLPAKETEKILYDYHERDFIAHFIEDHIGHWLQEIQQCLDHEISQGRSLYEAYVAVLPCCVFSENIKTYFKLKQQTHPDEFLDLLQATISECRRYIEAHEIDNKSLSEMSKSLDDAEKRHQALEKKLQKALAGNQKQQDALKQAKKQNAALSEKTSRFDVVSQENISLHKNNSDLQKELEKATAKADRLTDEKAALGFTLQTVQQENVNLNTVCAAQLTEIEEKTKSIHDLQKAQSSLEQEIRNQVEAEEQRKRQEEEELHRLSVIRQGRNALRPKSDSDFNEFLGYNLENIGIIKSEAYYPLLEHYLGKYFFRGKPIIMNRASGQNILVCLANILLGEKQVHMLQYSSQITEADISDFMSRSGRVICIDNFIGNFNESLLIPILEQYRDKIIILTVMYDRSLFYTAEELLLSCHYANVNRIPGILNYQVVNEDPSKLEEEEYHPEDAVENRYSKKLQGIMTELGFSPVVISQKCTDVSSEQDLQSVLVFEILPYCTDVMHIAPFEKSSQLIKFAGPSSRNTYKSLFQRWYCQ